MNNLQLFSSTLRLVPTILCKLERWRTVTNRKQTQTNQLPKDGPNVDVTAMLRFEAKEAQMAQHFLYYAHDFVCYDRTAMICKLSKQKNTERLICMESIIFKRYAHVGSLKWWTQCITVHIYLVQCFEFNSKFDQLRKLYCVQVLNSYTFDGWKWELLLWIIFKLDYILCLPNLAHSDCVAKYYYCSYLLMERFVLHCTK